MYPKVQQTQADYNEVILPSKTKNNIEVCLDWASNIHSSKGMLMKKKKISFKLFSNYTC